MVDIHGGRWAIDTNSSVPKGQGALTPGSSAPWHLITLIMDIINAHSAGGGCPRLLTTALLKPHLDRVSIYCVLDPEPSAADWRDI